jgi:hypothetical protein
MPASLGPLWPDIPMSGESHGLKLHNLLLCRASSTARLALFSGFATPDIGTSGHNGGNRTEGCASFGRGAPARRQKSPGLAAGAGGVLR